MRLSDYNVGRTLVINASWLLPKLKTDSSVLGWASQRLGTSERFSRQTTARHSLRLSVPMAIPWAWPAQIHGPCRTV